MLKTTRLTKSMEQRPSWDANWSSASQEISHILHNLKVHYHINKRPPPVPVLSQINPVYGPHPTSSRSILILFSHLCLCLAHGLLPSDLPMYLFYSNIKELLVIHWNCYVSSSCMRVKLSENPIQMTETTTHAGGESVCTVTVQITQTVS